MLLKNAAALLGANERYFTVVYEGFKFKDESTLSDYIDFILHEPVEWIKGFPLKLRTRASFAKPKAAVIKLLKAAAVLEALGVTYCSKAHDVVWDTFKKHADDILDARVKAGITGGDDVTNEIVDEHGSAAAPAVPPSAADNLEEVTDISGEELPLPGATLPVSPWERKYHILRSVVTSILHDYRDNIGLTTAVHTLLAILDAEPLPL
jgi:hypothetical protein